MVRRIAALKAPFQFMISRRLPNMQYILSIYLKHNIYNSFVIKEKQGIGKHKSREIFTTPKSRKKLSITNSLSSGSRKWKIVSLEMIFMIMWYQ